MSQDSVFDYNSCLELLTKNHPGEYQKYIITKAFKYARGKHFGQFRKTGEPYDQHPIKVALACEELKADYQTICAALLHDVVEDCNVPIRKIEKKFGHTIAKLVDGLTKVSTKDKNNKEYSDIQTFNKLIILVAEDFRIAVVKLFDRDHNLKTIHGHSSEEKRIRIANQTLDIYVPLAALVGIRKLKDDLEDRSFKIVDREAYIKILECEIIALGGNFNLCKALTDLRLKEPLYYESFYKLLDEAGINVLNIKYKAKSVYSIYKKLIRDGNIVISTLTSDDLWGFSDLITYRITIDSKYSNCLYKARNYIDNIYKPIDENSFYDFVSRPRNKTYKAVQTYNKIPFLGQDVNVRLEYQTNEMTRLADLGIASFWNYDDMKCVDKMQSFFKNMPEYSILIDLIDNYNIGMYSPEYFNKLVKKLVFSKRIYIELPNKATIQTYEGVTLSEFIGFAKKDFLRPEFKYYVNGLEVHGDYVLHDNSKISYIYDKSSDFEITDGYQRKKIK